MKVSIIVPIYNKIQYLPQFFESVYSQDYKDIELILVDNNSSDGSLELIRELEKKYSFVKVYQEKDQCTNCARLNGFLHATGDYIFFADPDDLLVKDGLSSLVKCAEEKDADIVCGNHYINYGNRTFLKSGLDEYSEDENLAFNGDYLLYFPALWNKLFKRSVLEKDDFVFVNHCEDQVVGILTFLRSEKVFHIDKPVYNYFKNPDSISNIKKKKRNYDWVFHKATALRYLEPRAKTYPKYEKVKEQFEYRLMKEILTLIAGIYNQETEEEKIAMTESIREYFCQNDYQNNKYLNKDIIYKNLGLVLNSKFNKIFSTKTFGNILVDFKDKANCTTDYVKYIKKKRKNK